MAKMPTYLKLMNPTLQALRDLGGSARIEELAVRVVQILDLPDEITEQPHGKGSQTEIEYRSAWARNYLKNYGLLENPQRRVWALTATGAKTERVDPSVVSKHVRELFKNNRKEKRGGPKGEVEPVDADWREDLLEILHEMPPDAFERLCQRVLRESGFIEVEVTGRSSDGGIDGHGIIQLAGMISFTVIFQAKRYRANVGAGIVRDFRGAMVGRADKGLIITTAGFTREARLEATRDGAPPIDLLTGNDLVDRLKELNLGMTVTTRMVEDVVIERAWFEGL